MTSINARFKLINFDRLRFGLQGSVRLCLFSVSAFLFMTSL